MPQLVGLSTVVATNGAAPTAITPNTLTKDGDVLLWFHFSNVDTGTETVTPPTGFNSIFNNLDVGNGLLACAWKQRLTGETTYTATVTNHTANNTSGDTILEWIETWSDLNVASMVKDVSTALSIWASSLTLGPITATDLLTVDPGGMVIVFAGRIDTVTAQTTLTGDGLDWAQGARGSSTTGRNAGAVTQYGINNTTSAVTLTSKSVTSTGIAQAGAGIMIVFNPPPIGTVGGVWPESNSFLGPFKDGNGNLYTMTELTDSPPKPCMRKSHDGGDTWLEMNAGGRPTSEDLESAWMVQLGTVIHVMYQRSGTMIVYYGTFNTSDAATNPDTWQIKDEIITTPATAPLNQAVSLVMKANGDAYGFYRSAPSGTDQRVAYKKKPSGGVWGSEVVIDSTAAKSFTQVQAILGIDAATIHVFYKNDTDSKVLWRTLSSSDVLSAATILNPSSTTTDDETMISPPAVLNVSGTERVLSGWKRLSDSMLIGVPINGGTAGSEETISHTAVYEDPPLTASLQTVGTLVPDETNDQIWALYADNATHDMWRRKRNGTWGTETETKDAAEIQYISATIFTHSAGNGGARVVGVIYDDAQGVGRGVPKYLEFVPPSGPPTLVVANVAQTQTARGAGAAQVSLIQENDGNVGTTRQSQVTVTLPGNLVAGRIITVELTSNNVPNFTPPASPGTWTQIVRQINTTAHCVDSFRHVVTAGEAGAPGSWLFQTQDASVRSLCWHVSEWGDQDPDAPIEATSSVIGAAGVVDIPTMTVSSGTAVVVATAWSSGAGAFSTVTEPTGFTELVDQHTAISPAATDSSEHMSWKLFATGGATGTLQCTSSSSGHSGIGYAIKPASGALVLTVGGGTTLTVANVAQAQTETTIALTQVHNLTVANVAQAQTETTIALVQQHNLVVANVAQAQTETTITINTAVNLVILNVAQAQTETTIALTQLHVLVVASVLQAQTETTVALTQVHNLTIANVAQAQTATSPTLAVIHNLVIANVAQAQTATMITLALPGQLSVPAMNQAQTTTTITLTQVHNLTVASVSQAQTETTIALVQNINLVVSNVAQAQTATVPTLVQQHNLTMQSVAQAQSATTLNFTGSTNLTVANVAQAQTVQSVVLERIFNLAVSNVAQTQTITAPVLVRIFNLVIQNALQGQSSSTISLTQLHLLVLQHMAQGQTMTQLLLAIGALPLFRHGSGVGLERGEAGGAVLDRGGGGAA